MTTSQPTPTIVPKARAKNSRVRSVCARSVDDSTVLVADSFAIALRHYICTGDGLKLARRRSMEEEKPMEEKIVLVICMHCGEKISTKWVDCPLCGQPQDCELPETH